MKLTPAQRELARHALGLPNDRKRSYRNRFIASKGHADFAEWEVMVATARLWFAAPYRCTPMMMRSG